MLRSPITDPLITDYFFVVAVCTKQANFAPLTKREKRACQASLQKFATRGKVWVSPKNK